MRISDWSSDVCSSDLLPGTTYSNRGIGGVGLPGPIPPAIIPYCDVRSRYDNCSSISEYNRSRGGGVSAQINHDFGFAKFASITSYRKGRSEARLDRSEEHRSELQYIMRISYAVFCLET